MEIIFYGAFSFPSATKWKEEKVGVKFMSRKSLFFSPEMVWENNNKIQNDKFFFTIRWVISFSASYLGVGKLSH